MILVGGKGTRLKALTKDMAKPAVSFGGKYRLIDFTLSNLTNSQIGTVGLVTQYEPYELMQYIARGASWDLDTIDGGITFLTPYAKNNDVLWQKGTAHAIAQYFNFIKEHQATDVLILSGDQIYKMDYQEMIKEHQAANRDLTIAVTEVKLQDATRFGIFEIDENQRVLSFEEKPKQPKSTKASMGIYLFKTSTLYSLLKNASNKQSVDFGKHIIPKALASGFQVGVHQFRGYWRDVGTIQSLYDANMDLLEDENFLGLNSSKHLPVYSKSLNLEPHIVLADGEIKQSVVSDGSVINGRVTHSTLGYRVHVHDGAVVEDCVILSDVVIGERAHLKNCIVNHKTVIPDDFIFTPIEVAILDQEELGGARYE